MTIHRLLVTKLLFLLIAILAFSSNSLAGGIRFVDDDAAPGGNGASWNTAYRFLQDALADAAGGGVDEIRAAQGTYKPDQSEVNPLGTGNRETKFQMLHGLALVGGYAGIGAKDPNARDFELYQTILSGEIGEQFGNSYHVISASGANQTVLLDGILITAGVANGPSPHNRGGGLIIDNGIAEVVNCFFFNNWSGVSGGSVAAGAAISSSASNLILTNCTFMQNRISSSDLISPIGGGAISASNSTITGSGCSFISNSVTVSLNSASTQGGAIRISSSTVLTLTDCLFANNRAFHDDQPGMSGTGGALYIWLSTATLTNCIFVGNRTPSDGSHGPSKGAGIYAIEADVELVNCLLNGNTMGGAGLGGGIYATKSNISTVNCTLTNNENGGIFLDDGSILSATNTILWGNAGGAGTPEGNQIDLANGSSVIINYSDVEGWTGQFGGSGNIGIDPLFVDPDGSDDIPGTEDDNLRLSHLSPCIDAANNSALPGSISSDLDGNPRYFDDPNTKDSGIGDPPIVDMGAYEFQGLLCPWDLDDSGSVDTSDLLALFAQWGTAGPADLNGDGIVDTLDLLILFANWGPCP